MLFCIQSGNFISSLTGKRYIAADRLNQQSMLSTKEKTPNSLVGYLGTDIGSQYGSTFDGFGNTTSTYGSTGGNTRERNRGSVVYSLVVVEIIILISLLYNHKEMHKTFGR